jgi:hypothetical protein
MPYKDLDKQKKYNAEYGKIWYQKNKVRLRKVRAKYREKNRAKMVQFQLNWRKKNPEKYRDWLIQWKEKNKEKLRARYRKYQRQNIEKIRSQKKQRFKTDKIYRLKTLHSARIRSGLRQFKLKKKESIKSIHLLGCTYRCFSNYLEKKFKNGMSWENMNKWEIDHIRALAKFNLSNISEQMKAFHYSNTQPLWRFENRSKGAN